MFPDKGLTHPDTGAIRKTITATTMSDVAISSFSNVCFFLCMWATAVYVAWLGFGIKVIMNLCSGSGFVYLVEMLIVYTTLGQVFYSV